MPSPLSPLLAGLRAAPDFEATSQALLTALLSDWPAEAVRPLRGAVHRRTNLGYDGLATREIAPRPRRASQPLGVTTSAWRWVRGLSGPVLLDVLARAAVPLGGQLPAEALAVGEAMSDATGRAFGARQATAVLALPVVGVNGELGAVVSIELQQTGADTPPPAFWAAQAAARQEAVDLAAPWILGRPLPPPDDALQDAHLPVVGAALAPRLSTLARLARFGDTVLLRGPPGAGKSSLVSWLHARSPRAAGAVRTIHVQNLPPDLVASELFGWKKDSFTGAKEDRKGLVAQADGGTLFLDEIGAIAAETQALLLQLLDDGRYTPVGHRGPPLRADVRVVLATNEDLEAAVAAGKFREDLYHRIAGACFSVPPLNERRDEIPRWAELFAERHRARCGLEGAVVLTPDALALLDAQPWPGNLRQLDQTLSSAVALAAGDTGTTVDARHLRDALSLRGAPPPSSPLEAVRQAGVALARLARQRTEADEPRLRLESLDVLRGYALRAAIADRGEKKQAFLDFGEERLVETRNHSAAWREQEERMRAFEQALQSGSSPDACQQHDRQRVNSTQRRARIRRK